MAIESLAQHISNRIPTGMALLAICRDGDVRVLVIHGSGSGQMHCRRCLPMRLDYEWRSALSVTTSQPPTGTSSPATGSIVLSFVSLIHILGAVFADQLTFALRSSPDAPKTLTIHASPSSLGLRASANTSAGSMRSGGGTIAIALDLETTSGWVIPMASRLAAAASYPVCGRSASRHSLQP